MDWFQERYIRIKKNECCEKISQNFFYCPADAGRSGRGIRVHHIPSCNGGHGSQDNVFLRVCNRPENGKRKGTGTTGFSRPCERDH